MNHREWGREVEAAELLLVGARSLQESKPHDPMVRGLLERALDHLTRAMQEVDKLETTQSATQCGKDHGGGAFSTNCPDCFPGR